LELHELREFREIDSSEDLEEEEKRLSQKEIDEIIREGFDELSKLESILEETDGKIETIEEDLHLIIRTEEKFQEVLQKNPSFMERLDAQEEMREISGYFRMMDDKKTGKTPKGLQRKELAEHYGIPDSSFNDWFHERVRPFGLKILEKLEIERVVIEQKVPHDARQHRIDSTLVYHTFRKLRFEPMDLQRLASTIINLDEKISLDVQIYYANMKPYSQLGMQWYKQISDFIVKNQEEIQKKLDTKHLRIGVVNNSLYVRRHEPCVNNWTDVHAVNHFHFESAKMKNKIVDEALLHLGGISLRNFGGLLNQLSDETGGITQGFDRYELRKTSSHLAGNTLGFILDVLGKEIQEVQSIKHISSFGAKRGRGKIESPEFSSDIEIIRAQLIGALMSDGHLRPKMSVHYYEKDQERLKRFKEIISQLGEIQYWETKRDDGYVIGLPAVVGRMLLVWGMPIGDKNILNSDLPTLIKTGADRVKQEYLSQMIAEDGSFSFKGGGWRIKWTRAVTLYSERMEKYGLSSRIDKSEQQFLTRYGERKTTDFKQSHSIKGSPTELIVISKGKLDEMILDSNSAVAIESQRFYQMIMKNESKLLESEKQIAEHFGINITRRWDRVVLYPETGKISLIWSCTTSRNRDAAIWAKIAPPDHARKMRMVDKALKWGLFERHLPSSFK